MRIGIDARFYGSLGKGLGRYTEKLIAHLERLDDRNDYFIFLRDENYSEYVPSNDRFHPVLADFQWYGWREQIFFPLLLNRYKLDCMHFLHFNVPLLYRKPFLVTIHDLILLRHPTIKASELPPVLYWLKYWVYRGVIASALFRAKKIFTVSRFTFDDLARHYPTIKKKLVITYEAADPWCTYVGKKESETFLRSLRLLEDTSLSSTRSTTVSFVLYVGNAYPHKNLTLMLEMARRFPHIRFVFVGKEDYFYRVLQQEAQDRKLLNVLFVGFISDRLLSVLYRHARLYFFPSLYEGFGLPALEACVYGLPVLASNRGSLREVLGEAGLFFDPADEDDCAAKMRELLYDEATRERVRQVGFRQLMCFEWEDMAQKTLATYEQSFIESKYEF